MLATSFLVAPVHAYDGAGLFALPVESMDVSPVEVAPKPAPAHALSLTALFQAALDYLGPQHSVAAHIELRPFSVNGIGGGLRLVAPLCESGCATTRPHSALPAGLSRIDILTLLKRTGLGDEDVILPKGAPGLRATYDEIGRSEAKVPQKEGRSQAR